MSDLPDQRRLRARRLRGYFDLQLKLAERLASLRGQSLSQTALHYTNLYRRFGLGRDVDRADDTLWPDFAKQLDACDGQAARLDLVEETFAACTEDAGPIGEAAFGCFGFETGAPGVILIHFGNFDSRGGVGPLHHSKQADRRADLAALFACIRTRHPDASELEGNSWLYNLDAYRRLFPESYVASRTPRAGPIKLTGNSSWGQLVRHDETLRGDVAAQFEARLGRLDPDAPWMVFPIRVLNVRAPLQVLYDHFLGPEASARD